MLGSARPWRAAQGESSVLERMPGRTRLLLAVLLALIAAALGWFGWSAWQSRPQPSGPVVEAPLPGGNTVSNLRVERDAEGRWFATFDYHYTGAPAAVTAVIEARGGEASPSARPDSPSSLAAKRGPQRARLEVRRPAEPEHPIRTRFLFADLRDSTNAVVARRVLEQDIDWPDAASWSLDRQAASKDPRELLALAAALIDRGDSDALATARAMLERQVARDPRFEPAYIELARVAMKTQRWPDGLMQARRLLDSALQIRPDSTDGKILMGYVLTHLGEFPKAGKLFSEAAAAGTSNLWLWANWGEWHSLQGQLEPAIEKYRQVLASPAKGDRNDRPRQDAYERLIALLQRRGDLDGLEALHKHRYEETGPRSCFGVDYARFLLDERGDTERAVALAREAVGPRCMQTAAKQVLALARYLEWSRAPAGSDRTALLNQAQVLLPMGPGALREMARSDRTASVIRELVAAGERIDQLDGRKFSALAYAINERDHAAARRLLRLGARTTTAVGEPPLPVALMPIMNSDAEGVRLMLQTGVDYANLRFEGTSGLEIARQIGDAAVLKTLRKASVPS